MNAYEQGYMDGQIGRWNPPFIRWTKSYDDYVRGHADGSGSTDG